MAEEDLYGLPLEDFIKARGDAAKAIRKAGDREQAALVAKLPKPSPAAWTVNQVAREHPHLIQGLLDAGAALRAAQDAALSGSGAGLREATVAERKAIEAVMTAATTYKPAGKALSRPLADRLRATLHAAAGDPAIRAALTAGQLVGDAQAGGAWPFAADEEPDLGALLGASLEKPAPAEPEPEEDPEAAAEAERAAAEARKALEAELKEARGTLRVRERAAKRADEDAEAAREQLTEAREAVEAAQRALTEAEEDADATERLATEARTARDEVRDHVARLSERLD